VACALRTHAGNVYTAIHLDATVGRIAVCAEPIAIGMAVAAGDTDLDTIVAVRHPRPKDIDRSIPIVSPCGMCRETLTDYGPEMHVLLPGPDGGWERSPVGVLLPIKYTRRQEPVGEHGDPSQAV
jgi:cytidine deaminase